MTAHHPNPRPDIIKILDDEKEHPYTSILCRGYENKNPISVEEYADEVLLQPTIAASIAFPNALPISVDEYTDEVLLQHTIAQSISFSKRVIHLDNDGEGNPKDGKGPIIGHQMVYPRRPLKILFREHSSTEIGESSNSKRPPIDVDALIDIDLYPDAVVTTTVPPTAFCAICMDSKLLSECFGLKGCSHMFCRECINLYVAARIQENVTVILCPDPECKKGSLEPEMCRSILPPEVFDRWGAALCESLIIGLMKFYCPFKDCSALLIDETSCGNGEVIRESECPHCYRLFCAQCKVPWHTGVACEEFQKLGADERQREDIMLMEVAKKNKWQRCPKCKFYVERTEGCMFILCRCGHRFCYGCASPMTIDHYCQKCRR